LHWWDVFICSARKIKIMKNFTIQKFKSDY
jgi:hypothetical protein